MPSLIGALAAFVALAAGILSHVDPVASIGRACLAYMLGWFATNVWYVFFTVRIEPISTDRANASETPAEG
ncbi:MAG: hypothetical protein ABL949_15485 [Fimbriimonadaceae bacterium]